MQYQEVIELLNRPGAQLDTRFAAAAEFGKVLKETTGQQLEREHKGKMYGLYKQARYGQFDHSKKPMNSASILTPMYMMYTVLKEQHWIGMGDMSQDEAKQKYIEAITEYANLEKYQPLIANLDFGVLVLGSANFNQLKLELGIDEGSELSLPQTEEEVEAALEKIAKIPLTEPTTTVEDTPTETVNPVPSLKPA